MARRIGHLPHALLDGGGLARRLSVRRPAVFLDYDGTLTPIVERPEDALISESMRGSSAGWPSGAQWSSSVGETGGWCRN